MSAGVLDQPITHKHVSQLTPEEFIKEYVNKNQPIIISGALTQWQPPPTMTTTAASDSADSLTKPGEWTIGQLQAKIGDLAMTNVFVSSAAHKARFKYFKQPSTKDGVQESTATASLPSSSTTASSPPPSTSIDQQPESGLSRANMTFNEFVARSVQAAEGSDDHAYYLYGEPMPPALQSHFPNLDILSAISDPLTSTLLWVSPATTCSPLHYDLSEGILAQVHGAKKITLIDPKYYEQLYPYPLQHAHDRQSRINDIHAPSATEFPLALNVPRLSGLVEAGSFLYIPYGWWHQLESVKTSISVSQRWNPYTDGLQRLAASWHVTSSLPTPVREQICRTQLDAVPKVVALVNRRRWNELPRAQNSK